MFTLLTVFKVLTGLVLIFLGLLAIVFIKPSDDGNKKTHVAPAKKPRGKKSHTYVPDSAPTASSAVETIIVAISAPSKKPRGKKPRTYVPDSAPTTSSAVETTLVAISSPANSDVNMNHPLIIKLMDFFSKARDLMQYGDNEATVLLLEGIRLIRKKMCYICQKRNHPLYGKLLVKPEFLYSIMNAHNSYKFFFGDIKLSELLHIYLNRYNPNQNKKFSGMVRELQYFHNGLLELRTILDTYYISEIITILENNGMCFYFFMNNWYYQYKTGLIVPYIPSETEYDIFAQDVCSRMTEWLEEGNEGLVWNFCNILIVRAHEVLISTNLPHDNYTKIKAALDDVYKNHPILFEEFCLAWTIVVMKEGNFQPFVQMPIMEGNDQSLYETLLIENFFLMPISDDIRDMMDEINDPELCAIDDEIGRLTPTDEMLRINAYAQQIKDSSIYDKEYYSDYDFSDDEVDEFYEEEA